MFTITCSLFHPSRVTENVKFPIVSSRLGFFTVTDQTYGPLVPKSSATPHLPPYCQTPPYQKSAKNSDCVSDRPAMNNRRPRQMMTYGSSFVVLTMPQTKRRVKEVKSFRKSLIGCFALVIFFTWRIIGIWCYAKKVEVWLSES